MESQTLKKYCQKWNLKKPQLLTQTATAEVYTVLYQDAGAVLKLLNPFYKSVYNAEANVLNHYQGHGAIYLYEYDEGALLLEQGDGLTLKELVIKNQDEEATKIACKVINDLHQVPPKNNLNLIGMRDNFKSLFFKATLEPRSIFSEAAHLMEYLLNTQQGECVLHGDIHHTNILHSADRGWLAIDPKGVLGEKTYDIANLFYNPIGRESVISQIDVIKNRSRVISETLQIDQKRVLQYAFCYGSLSAAWHLEDYKDVSATMTVLGSVKKCLDLIS